MIKITFPDGSQRVFERSLTVGEVAAVIAPSLARSAIAAKVNGVLVDLGFLLVHDVSLEILTDKNPESLDVVRHSTAHLLAAAAKQLFPDIQVTIGPTIADGFYYDFAYSRPLTPDDLSALELRMRELTKLDTPVVRKTMNRDEAVSFFLSLGERYKAEIIASIPEGQEISLYQQGDFVDLCRGPHVPTTGKLRFFKLMKVAGAYWRGDSRNQMLQRVYGTAWLTQADLDLYLQRLEEAEKRDHRKLGKQLDLFHLQEEAPGLVFWHPKGWTLWQQVEQYMRRLYREYGYQEIRCPQILDRTLWEKSGHWENFHENMFITASENRDYALKPMNCPGHIQVFKSDLRSYRDLPLRYGEFGACHRNEPSGALHGIMRVRGFIQDDGHIFCAEEDLQAEVTAFNTQVQRVYRDFGFHEVLVKLALRPERRVGSDETWDKAEEALRQALRASKLQWTELPGEGAFYGPKIEFHIQDALGRTWQCGTMQVDFSMPGRLGAEYVAEDNSRRVPVMLHRAMVGSLERFIGILIESYAGKFPLWLSPVQVVVMNVTSNQASYATEIVKTMKECGIRVIADLRNEKISYKIREHSLQKIPYQIVVGDKEVAANELSVRAYGGVDLGVMALTAFLDRVRDKSVAGVFDY